MQSNPNTPRKSIANLIGQKLATAQLWAAVAGCLVLSATLIPAGAISPMEDAKPQSCTSTCYDRYYTCIYSGKGSTYCQAQLSYCLSGCGGVARMAE